MWDSLKTTFVIISIMLWIKHLIKYFCITPHHCWFVSYVSLYIFPYLCLMVLILLLFGDSESCLCLSECFKYKVNVNFWRDLNCCTLWWEAMRFRKWFYKLIYPQETDAKYGLKHSYIAINIFLLDNWLSWILIRSL